ncbi:MAG: DUF835 domain-containing protein [Candidatus Thermoplasmatota archaeon]|nr:DUF835 domain-containing protein [Candidatus Thermoplasmatota archaeon]
MGYRSRLVLSSVLIPLLISAFCCVPVGVMAADAVDVSFTFVPGRSYYCPGDVLDAEVMVVNAMPSGDYVYDELAYMVKVQNVSIHLSWMAPNEFAWTDVSNSSEWLAPDGVGVGTYTVDFCVPENALDQSYSYYFKLTYLVHTAWGNITYTWGVGTTYGDFDVATQLAADDPRVVVDYVPYLAFFAVVLSIGALGAVMYHRRSGGADRYQEAKAASIAHTITPDGAFPTIHPVPGEHFPIEKGFIYLVKEKRPAISITMYNEAVEHGAKGMLVVREHPDRLRKVIQFQAEKMLWLTRRAGKDHVDPTELSLVTLLITKFAEAHTKAVVMIEGLEYMITQNDFETVLRFVNHLHDFVLTHDCAIVLVIDPRVLNMRELALMERSAKVVEPYEPFDSDVEEERAEAQA